MDINDLQKCKQDIKPDDHVKNRIKTAVFQYKEDTTKTYWGRMAMAVACISLAVSIVTVSTFFLFQTRPSVDPGNTDIQVQHPKTGYDWVHSELTIASKNDIAFIEKHPDAKKLIMYSIQLEHIFDLNKYSLLELESIDLRYNKISELSPVRNLKHLTHLDASLNNIETITSLENLFQLESLILSDNSIKQLDALKNLQNLTTLDVSNNHQIGEYIESIDFSNMTALNYLSMSSCQLRTISFLNTKALEELNILYLENNLLEDLTPLQNIKNLRHLDLSNNAIQNLSALKDHQQLRTLYLTKNKITDLTPLSKLTNLEYLYVPNNNIQDISALADLKNLSELDLSHNKITDPGILSPLGQTLSYLDLSYNNISSIESLKHYTGLNVLILTGNPLTNQQINELAEALPKTCKIVSKIVE